MTTKARVSNETHVDILYVVEAVHGVQCTLPWWRPARRLQRSVNGGNPAVCGTSHESSPVSRCADDR